MLSNNALATAIQVSLLIDEAIGPGSYVDMMFTNLMAEDPMRFFDSSGMQVPGLFERNPDASGCGIWNFIVNDKVELPIQLRFTAPVTISSIVEDSTVACGCTTKTVMVNPGDTFNIRLQLLAVDPACATANEEAEAARQAAILAAGAHAAAIACAAASAAEAAAAEAIAIQACRDAAKYAEEAALATVLADAQEESAQATAAAITAKAAAAVADTNAARTAADAAQSSANSAAASLQALIHKLCCDNDSDSDDEARGAEGIAIAQNTIATAAAVTAASATTVLDAQRAVAGAAAAAATAAAAAAVARTVVAIAAADNAEMKAVAAAASLTSLQAGLAAAVQEELTERVESTTEQAEHDCIALLQVATNAASTAAPSCVDAANVFVQTLQELANAVRASADISGNPSARERDTMAQHVYQLASAAVSTASADVSGAQAVYDAAVAEAATDPSKQQNVIAAAASLASKQSIATAAATALTSATVAATATEEAARAEKIACAESRAISNSILAMIAASHAASDAAEALQPGASHSILDDAIAEEHRAKAAAIDTQLVVGIVNTQVTINALALAQEKHRETLVSIESIRSRICTIPCPIPPIHVYMGDMCFGRINKRKCHSEGERLLSRLDISGTVDVISTRPYIRNRRRRKDSEEDISGTRNLYCCSVNWTDSTNKAVVYTICFYSRTSAGIGCGELVQTITYNPSNESCKPKRYGCKVDYRVYSSFPMVWNRYYYATISAINIRGESPIVLTPSSVYVPRM